MSMYMRETYGTVPISLNESKLKIYEKLYDSYTLPGITDDSSLKDIVKSLPNMSSIQLWVSKDTKYGQEVIQDTQNSKLIGNLLISNFWLYCNLYVWSCSIITAPAIYFNVYYSSTGVSIWGKWYQVQLKAVS